MHHDPVWQEWDLDMAGALVEPIAKGLRQMRRLVRRRRAHRILEQDSQHMRQSPEIRSEQRRHVEAVEPLARRLETCPLGLLVQRHNLNRA